MFFMCMVMLDDGVVLRTLMVNKHVTPYLVYVVLLLAARVSNIDCSYSVVVSNRT